jgi:hypothetical protein
MSLFSKLLQAVHSWRLGRRGPKSVRRAAVTMERLDHRQLLSVNFTGNVVTDFPANQIPGVVVLPDNPNVVHPVIAPSIAPIVKVSGFDISGIRVSYTPTDDVLSIGIEQPPSQQPGQPGPVIAGDADNNGNDGTVNPAVLATPGFSGFKDFPDFGGSEFMEAFLDLKQVGTPDVVAGFAQNDPRSPKQYQVAQAIVNPSPGVPPAFGTMLSQFIGNVYKVNSPANPNLEFSINHFSQLYLQETGKPLTPGSVIGLGAAAGSADDVGISEAFFPEQTFTLSQATVPPPPVCPPASPPILINPHQNRHINTAHPDLIRVTVLGSSGFDVRQINPATVTFGGAHPVFSFTKMTFQNGFLDETFVFKGTDVHLPPGITQGTLTGMLNNGQSFSSSETIFNRDASFYTPAAVQQQQARIASRGGDRPGLPQSIGGLESKNTRGVTYTSPTGTAAASLPTPQAQVVPAGPMISIPGVSDQSSTGPVVSINRRGPVISGHAQTRHIPTRLLTSMDRFLQQGGAPATAQ